jgi:hypothetical protein
MSHARASLRRDMCFLLRMCRTAPPRCRCAGERECWSLRFSHRSSFLGLVEHERKSRSCAGATRVCDNIAQASAHLTIRRR